jgi:hypothetical protein
MIRIVCPPSGIVIAAIAFVGALRFAAVRNRPGD